MFSPSSDLPLRYTLFSSEILCINFTNSYNLALEHIQNTQCTCLRSHIEYSMSFCSPLEIKKFIRKEVKSFNSLSVCVYVFAINTHWVQDMVSGYRHQFECLSIEFFHFEFSTRMLRCTKSTCNLENCFWLVFRFLASVISYYLSLGCHILQQRTGNDFFAIFRIFHPLPVVGKQTFRECFLA